MALVIEPDILWIVIVAFIVAFVLAFGIGANDVANSFGTSVGSKVLTLRQACILASIFEVLGAVLIGYRVSDTIRKGIVDVAIFNGTEEELMVGELAALGGSGIWLLIATFLSLPVSGTHSIVGATMGFSIVAHGLTGINWTTLGLIISSWFISPLLSGAISCTLFYTVRRFILTAQDSLESGLRFLPFFYGFTILINFFSIFYKGPQMLHFDKIPFWGSILLSVGGGLLTAVFIHCIVSPRLRRKIRTECVYTRKQTEISLLENVTENGDILATHGSQGTIQGQDSLLEIKAKLKQESQRRESGCKEPDLEDVKNVDETAEDANSNGKKSTVKFQLTADVEEIQANGCTKLPTLHEQEDGLTSLKTKVVGMKNSSYMPLLSTGSSATTPVGTPRVTPGQTPTGSAVPSRTGSDTNLIALVNSSKISKKEKKSEEQLAREAIQHDSPEAHLLFTFLQILTATFGSFAHGGNDVSNAIGPVIAVWLIATEGHVMQTSETPIWILFYGGAGICLGLWIWGRRVIKTMGEDLTPITPSSGFTIELGAALTVLLASNLGIPVSTTHCKVGSVVFVGFMRSRRAVDWRLFRNIVVAWLVTVPVAGGMSAALMAGLLQLV